MYALEHHVYGWFLGAIVFENAIGLVGPNDLSGVRFPPEAACMTEPLSFGLISFTAQDGLFRKFTLRDIHYRADNFVVACLVRKGMCEIMKMLYRTIRHQQPMLIIKVTSALRRTTKGVFDEAHIVRMSSLQYQIGCRFRAGRVPINSSRFVGPKYPLG